MELGILIAQLLLKYGPDVARGARQILTSGDPTSADWEKVFALADKSYADLVPASKLPAE